MSDTSLDFVHRFVPGGVGATPTLLLLHGTGGDESDLLPLGGALAPGAALLSPRGKVLERGMPRFFRRIAEGVFDLEDLKFRTHQLARFVRAAASHYGFTLDSLYAIGFSNGANIAASLLLLEPGLLRGAVLWRPMMPLEPDRVPALAGTSVLIGGGRLDPMTPAAQTEALASYLRSAGADVTLRWENAGHGLSQGDVDAAREWLAQRMMVDVRRA